MSLVSLSVVGQPSDLRCNRESDQLSRDLVTLSVGKREIPTELTGWCMASLAIRSITDRPESIAAGTRFGRNGGDQFVVGRKWRVDVVGVIAFTIG
jgi:hypothetical protein